MTASTERPTPETDAFYRYRENLERVSIVEAGTIAVKWAECGKHARRLERQRDALAEALRFYADQNTYDTHRLGGPEDPPDCYCPIGEDQGQVARAALAALERGDGKEAAGGVQHDGCNYLAPVGHVCNKCGQVVRAAKERS